MVLQKKHELKHYCSLAIHPCVRTHMLRFI